MSTTEPSRGRRFGILAICCLSLFIVGIDITAVNLALPAIGRDLAASGSELQWVIDAYTLVLASLLMLSGSTGDRLGRRRVFQIGLALFGLGSLLCSLAPSPAVLIGARMLQAIGGSMLNPVAMSIITNTFRDARERARAIGIWGSVVGLSMALGPVIGGALVDALSWRAIFWLNLPIVVAALVLTGLFVPESRAEQARRLDPLAQVLVILALATLTYAIIEGRNLGWTSATVLGCLLVAVLSSAALVAHERRRDQPLLDPRFFRSLPFTGAILSAVVGLCAFGGFLFLNTLYLQEVRGMAPLTAGLMTLPMAGAMAILSPVSGAIVGSRGPRLPLVLSGAFLALSGVLLVGTDGGTPLWYLALAYLCFGVGMGLLNAPITNSAVSGMPRGQAGVAAAMASTSRQIGTSLGVAVLPAIMLSRLQGDLVSGFPAAAHGAWLVVVGCGLVLLLLGFWVTGRGALRSRDRVAAELGMA